MSGCASQAAHDAAQGAPAGLGVKVIDEDEWLRIAGGA